MSDEEEFNEEFQKLTTKSFTDKQNFKISKTSGSKLSNDQLLWNILPSYELYSAQFLENHEPPTYQVNASDSVGEGVASELSSITQPTAIDSLLGGPSSGGPSVNRSSVDGPSLATSTSGADQTTTNSAPTDDNIRITFNDTNGNQWQNTILDNVDYLNNMTHSDNPYTNHLKIELFFTKNIAERDVEPEIIEPKEYKQGDSINGFLTIKNTLNEDIKFNLFYILLEGLVNLRISKHETKKFKFLEMFDFYGGYHPGYINRLVTSYLDPSVCPCSVDSQGYHDTFVGKIIKANTKYKRYFSFKIPNQLLDQQCNHVLTSHLDLVPTMGHKKDFSHNGDSINYQISTVFIGKSNHYNFNPMQNNAKVFNAKGEEYVILKSNHFPITITPLITKPNHLYQKLVYDNFIKRINEKIKLMEKVSLLELGKLKPNQVSQLIESVENQISHEESNKLPQLYYPPDNKPTVKSLDLKIDVSTLLKSGEITLSTPETIYDLPYPISGKLTIPISLSASNNVNSKIKHLQVELSVVTFRSTTAIPLEINHSIVYKNDRPNMSTFNDTDTFKFNVKEYFTSQFTKIKNLCRTTSIENFKIEKDLIDDLRTLAMISDKTINLLVSDIKFVQDGQLVKVPKLGDFDIIVDMASLIERGGKDKFHLGPSFQSCYVGRMYYLRVWIGLSNGNFCFKLPVYVNNEL